MLLLNYLRLKLESLAESGVNDNLINFLNSRHITQKFKLTETKLVPIFEPSFFLRISYEYINACEALEKSANPGFYLNVQYYLLCHALEIAMKSILIMYGWNKGELKADVDHDLIEAINILVTNNLYKFNKEDTERIRLINEFYSKKGFEYLEFAGSKVYPRLKELKEVTWKVIRDANNLIESFPKKSS